jgi:DNA-binding FadR family transcriptional regulator
MIERLPPRPSATAAAERALRESIVSGELRPGDRLPPERALSVKLGVSRLTLRAALATLSAAGLISVRHGSGYTVRDLRDSGGTDLLPGLVQDLSGREGSIAATDLLRMRRHLAAAVLEAIAETPPTVAARRAIHAAIDRFEAATAALHAARATVASIDQPATAPRDPRRAERSQGGASADHDDPRRGAERSQRGASADHDDPRRGPDRSQRGASADHDDPRRRRTAGRARRSSTASATELRSDGFPGGEQRAAAAALRDAETEIVDADLGVVRALLDATGSLVLRVCLNPIMAVLRDSEPLRAAIYAAPGTNLIGWRALGVWIEKPDATSIPRLLGVLAERDRNTVTRLGHTRKGQG